MPGRSKSCLVRTVQDPAELSRTCHKLRASEQKHFGTQPWPASSDTGLLFLAAATMCRRSKQATRLICPCVTCTEGMQPRARPLVEAKPSQFHVQEQSQHVPFSAVGVHHENLHDDHASCGRCMSVLNLTRILQLLKAGFEDSCPSVAVTKKCRR